LIGGVPKLTPAASSAATASEATPTVTASAEPSAIGAAAGIARVGFIRSGEDRRARSSCPTAAILRRAPHNYDDQEHNCEEQHPDEYEHAVAHVLP
jgi:hypothetical protein